MSTRQFWGSWVALSTSFRVCALAMLAASINAAAWFPAPHVISGSLGGVADGRLHIVLEGASVEARLFVKDGELGNIIQIWKGGAPASNEGVTYDLSANGGAITGKINDFTLNAAIAGGTVTGTYSGTGTGSLSGRLHTWAELKALEDPISGPEWRQWQGPNYNFGAASGHAIVMLPSEARQVWRSEERTPAGLGSISRSATNPYSSPFGGGSASPIVAEGKVYQFYHVPSGTVYDTSKLSALAATYAELEAQYGAAMVEEEKQRWLIAADDVVLCMDALTGQTLWKTVYAGKGANWQDHKGGYNNLTMCYAEGRVYAVGSTNRYYCLDASTGQTIWENPQSSGHFSGLRDQYLAAQKGGAPFFGTGRGESWSPVYVDGVVVMYTGGSLLALDGATGAEKWRSTGVQENSPVVWRYEGNNYLLTLGENAVVCVRPADGSEVWRSIVPGVGSHGPSIEGDFAAVYCNANSVSAGRIDLEGYHELWKHPLADMMHCQPPVITRGYVFASYSYSTTCFDLITGERLANIDGVNAERTGSVQLIEDRLFVQRDGRHGKTTFDMLGALESTYGAMGTTWTPPHWGTTAYSNGFIAHPYVDGRLIVRGNDGVYCYDLRRKPALPRIAVSAPADGHSMLTTATTNLAATVSGGSVAGVTFFVDGEEVGTTASSPYEVTWGTPVRGSHRVYARATDSEGNVSYSPVIRIKVEQAPCVAGPRAVANPAPANGEAAAGVFGLLTWEAEQVGTDVPTSYVVHLGTSPNPPVVDTLDGIDLTRYNPGPLQGSTKYYWRVDAVNSCGSAAGTEWSFTTQPFTGFRFLRFVAVAKSGSLAGGVQELDWVVSGTNYPQVNLTSNSDQGVTVTTSAGTDGFEAYDGDPATGFSIGTPPQSVTIDLGAGNGIMPDRVVVRINNGGGRALTWVAAYGSEDGETWIELYDGSWPGGETQTLMLVPGKVVDEEPVNAGPAADAGRARAVTFAAIACRGSSGPMLQIAVPSAQRVRLEVFGLDGRMVTGRTLALDAGRHTVVLEGTAANRVLVWRLRAASGQVVSGRTGLR